MSESVELWTQINTRTTTRHHQDEELTMQNVRFCRTVFTDRHHKRETMLSKVWFVNMFEGSLSWVLQNLGFGRVEMRFVHTVYGIRKMVLQNLSFRRVEATMCCGEYHVLTIARAKKWPRSVIVWCNSWYEFEDSTRIKHVAIYILSLWRCTFTDTEHAITQ